MSYYVLLIFAPLLIIVGIAGFLIPRQKSLTSGAPAYNIFHIAFGLIGFVTLYLEHGLAVRAFLVGFGAIDLYQAVVSFAHFFSEKYFRWTRADDILHLVIGVFLILAGLLG